MIDFVTKYCLFFRSINFFIHKRSRPAPEISGRYFLANCFLPRNNSKGYRCNRGYITLLIFKRSFSKIILQFIDCLLGLAPLSFGEGLGRGFKTLCPYNNSPSNSHICYNCPSHLFVGSLLEIGHKKHENLCR